MTALRIHRVVGRPLCAWRRSVAGALIVCTALVALFVNDACAAPLGTLPQQFDQALANYQGQYQRFLGALHSRPSSPEICNDTELLGLLAATMRSFTHLQTIHSRMQSRQTGDLSEEDQAALQAATRRFADAPSRSALLGAYAAQGGCEGYQIHEGLQKQEAERLREEQSNTNFLSGLLREALGDAEAGGDPEPEDGEAVEAETAVEGSGWQQARFLRLIDEFNEAYNDFTAQAKTFLDLLNQLAACCHDEVCEDLSLASSYASADAALSDMLFAYEAIIRMVGGMRSHDPLAGYITLTGQSLPDATRLPIEDQLAFAQVTARRDKAVHTANYIQTELHAQAPGCDSDDLADRGRQVGESGQDTETGVDGGATTISGGDGGGLTAAFTGSPTTGAAPLKVNFTDQSYGGEIDSYFWTFGDGGSSSLRNPSHTYQDDGTYTVTLTVANTNGAEDTEAKAGYITVGSDELRYVKSGDLFRNENTQTSCNGGLMTLEITSDPVLPQEIRPDGQYTVSIPVSWQVSGIATDEFVFVVVLHFPGFNRMSEQIRSPRSGSRTFEFSFSGSEANFNWESAVLTIEVSGGLACTDASTGEVNSTLVQTYLRQGGN